MKHLQREDDKEDMKPKEHLTVTKTIGKKKRIQ